MTKLEELIQKKKDSIAGFKQWIAIDEKEIDVLNQYLEEAKNIKNNILDKILDPSYIVCNDINFIIKYKETIKANKKAIGYINDIPRAVIGCYKLPKDYKGFLFDFRKKRDKSIKEITKEELIKEQPTREEIENVKEWIIRREIHLTNSGVKVNFWLIGWDEKNEYAYQGDLTDFKPELLELNQDMLDKCFAYQSSLEEIEQFYNILYAKTTSTNTK